MKTLAVPGAPAPIRALPVCEQLNDPPTGASPVKSDYLTVSSSGSIDGSASVFVNITPSIPPCATTATPSTCYIGINGTLGPFAEVEDPDPDPEPDPSSPFTDVPADSFAIDDIALLVELEITNGVNRASHSPRPYSAAITGW